MYEYRHVILPKELAKSLQAKRLLAENEWRALGVQQSRGWAHYAIHRPEPHILLFPLQVNIPLEVVIDDTFVEVLETAGK